MFLSSAPQLTSGRSSEGFASADTENVLSLAVAVDCWMFPTLQLGMSALPLCLRRTTEKGGGCSLAWAGDLGSRVWRRSSAFGLWSTCMKDPRQEGSVPSWQCKMPLAQSDVEAGTTGSRDRGLWGRLKR